jgi:hypothetical protein
MQKLTIALAALGLGMASASQASTITLDTSILPSAQGWTYFGSGAFAGIPETNFFSNVGGELVQNTMGSGFPFVANTNNLYLRPISLAPGETWKLSVVARIAQSEQLPSTQILAPYGFIFSVATNPDYYLTSVDASGRVSTVFDGNSAFQLPGVFDPNAYNLYEVNGGGGTFSLKFNGTTVFSGKTPLNFPAPQLLLLGDGSFSANANVFIRSYSFTSGAVPEPASWALMIAGFGIVGGALRSRKLAAVATA